MSATLQIRLIFRSIKFATLAQTLVTVRQVFSDNDTYPDAPFETATLLSRANNAHKIKVPQGTYKVEARFPNGTFARQICVVRDNETYHVKLPVEPARHSWLEWQTGTGNIALAIGDSPRSREVSDTQVKEDLQTQTNSHIQVSHLSYFLQRLPTDPALIGLTKRNTALNRQIENIAPWNLKKHITLPPTVVYATPNFMSLQPNFRSEMPFKHNSDDIVTLWSMHAIDQEQVSNTYRAVAVFSAKRRDYFAFLPDNWRLSNGQIASLEFLYDPTKQPGRELRISVVDSECSGLLSYLGAGRMPEALLAFDAEYLVSRILEDIKTGRSNPFVAAAVAYVGLSIPVGDQKREICSSWLEKFSGLFPHMPDAAVVYARDRVERARTHEDLQVAFQGFIEAYRRGPPQFSTGVRYLLDGLSMFRDISEQYGVPAAEMAFMYNVVARFALWTDPDQIFTVISMDSILSDV